MHPIQSTHVKVITMTQNTFQYCYQVVCSHIFCSHILIKGKANLTFIVSTQATLRLLQPCPVPSSCTISTDLDPLKRWFHWRHLTKHETIYSSSRLISELVDDRPLFQSWNVNSLALCNKVWITDNPSNYCTRLKLYHLLFCCLSGPPYEPQD